MLSQFPAEKEILFAPLTGLEVASVPRPEGDVLVVELRLSCNLNDLTIEQVIGKMQTGHKTMVQNMIDEFKHCSSADKVLQPLNDVLEKAMLRGFAFFNVHAPPVAPSTDPCAARCNRGHLCAGRCPAISAKRPKKH